MEKIAIYGQYLHDDTAVTMGIVLEELHKYKKVSISVEQRFLKLLQDAGSCKNLQSFTDLDASYDLLISIGGDGTMLRAVSFIGNIDVPVVGINTGRLGFLATIKQRKIKQALDKIMNDDYTLSKRSLITVNSNHATNHTAPDNFALNEITVSRMNTTSMIQIETHLNDKLLTSYWADGLIISTPTGSTGYSLSCGGPVITPATSSLVITPIAPHNLNARPLVIPDDMTIRIKVIGREDAFLASLDNRIASYPNETELIIKKAAFTIDLIQLEGHSFINTIREKLLWGEDKRN